MEFEIGDKVFLTDDTSLVYNDYYNVEKKLQLKLNKEYKVIDYEKEFDEEILYVLQDIETKEICEVMVNGWEIEKSECNA